ncbi:MAG: hypothetical protein ACREF9_19145, partial [Opitutaceae bacterium]
MNRETHISPSRRGTVLWGLLVLVAVLWTAREVPDFDFVAWDDELNILVNPNLGPPTPHNLAWMFTDFSYMRRYVPFGWLGFSVAYAFSGLSPLAYHIGNLLLHTANALLLYLLIAWALRRWHSDPDEHRIAPSAAAGALLWAIHPLRAETVGWASGMLYTQACFFALLSVLVYCRAQSPGRRGGNPSDAGPITVRRGAGSKEPGALSAHAWYWTAVLLYAVSMLTYPITIGLLAVFVVIDVVEWRRRNRVGALRFEGGAACPPAADVGANASERVKDNSLHRSFQQHERSRAAWLEAGPLVVEKIPFLAAAFAVSTVTVFSRVTAGSFWPQAPDLAELSLIDRLVRAFYTVAYYLWKTCWPVNLSPLPPQLSEVKSYWAAAVLSTIGICVTTYFLWRARQRRPGALLLWLCYLILLVPMLGFAEKSFYIADRYSYLPTMTVSVALSAALVSLSRQVYRMSAIVVVAGLVTFVVMTSVQLRVWPDSTTLFARCVELAG